MEARSLKHPECVANTVEEHSRGRLAQDAKNYLSGPEYLL
jgi:hypothetical protein